MQKLYVKKIHSNYESWFRPDLCQIQFRMGFKICENIRFFSEKNGREMMSYDQCSLTTH